MTRTPRYLALATLLALAAPLESGAAYRLKPVTIRGNPAQVVSTINASGIIGGTFLAKPGMSLGFVRDGENLTVLPKVYNDGFGIDDWTPVPTSINDAGEIAGYATSGEIWGFVRKGHKYVTGFTISEGGGFDDRLPAVTRNSHGELAFNGYGGQYSGYYGKTNPFTLLNVGGFSYILSINKHGVIAGNYYPYPQHAVFTYANGTLTEVLGPGKTDALGGYINDSGAVAGTYYKADNSLHGFVLEHGRYMSFDAPVLVTTMSVEAFSNSGIVAGTYMDSAGASHGFAWNGKNFSEVVPNPSANETVAVVGVSDAGDVALDLYNKTTGTNVPYIAHCQDGC